MENCSCGSCCSESCPFPTRGRQLPSILSPHSFPVILVSNAKAQLLLLTAKNQWHTQRRCRESLHILLRVTWSRVLFFAIKEPQLWRSSVLSINSVLYFCLPPLLWNYGWDQTRKKEREWRIWGVGLWCNPENSLEDKVRSLLLSLPCCVCVCVVRGIFQNQGCLSSLA